MRLKVKASVAVILTGEESFVMQKVAESFLHPSGAAKASNAEKRTRSIVEDFVKSMASMANFHEMVAEFHHARGIEDQHDDT